MLYRGLAQELLGAHDAAMRDFTGRSTPVPCRPTSAPRRCCSAASCGTGWDRLDEAIADYSAVIAMKGEGLATALNNRANIYRRQNRLMEAQRDYLAALAPAASRNILLWPGPDRRGPA